MHSWFAATDSWRRQSIGARFAAGLLAAIVAAPVTGCIPESSRLAGSGPGSAARQEADAVENLQDDAVDPRFAATLAATDVSTATMSRQALQTSIESRLATLRHARREPSSPNAPDDNPETVRHNQRRLSRGDLLTIRLLLEGLSQQSVLRQLDQLARADRADKTSEHGGVLVWENGSLRAESVPPWLVGHDMAYIASDQLMARAKSALAIFHFHAQQPDNAEIAGPGVGDLRFAATVKTSCVVITTLTGGEMDVDYYNPEGAVVDLGIYQVLR
jgi:hypothetical protein